MLADWYGPVLVFLLTKIKDGMDVIPARADSMIYAGATASTSPPFITGHRDDGGRLAGMAM